MRKLFAAAMLFLAFSIGFTAGVYSTLAVTSVKMEELIQEIPQDRILLDDRG